MDDLGFNKIAGAVLATGLGMMILMKLPAIFMGHTSEDIAYKVGAIETDNNAPEAVDLPFPQQDWVDAMDATRGAKVFKKCASCHNVDADSPTLTDLPANWTYEALDAFLTKPTKYAPGTKMNYVGLKKPADRAAVIEYLRLADPTPAAKPIAQPAEPIVPAE